MAYVSERRKAILSRNNKDDGKVVIPSSNVQKQNNNYISSKRAEILNRVKEQPSREVVSSIPQNSKAYTPPMNNDGIRGVYGADGSKKVEAEQPKQRETFLDKVKKFVTGGMGSVAKDVASNGVKIKSDEEVYTDMNPYGAALEKGATQFVTGLNNVPRAIIKATGNESDQLDELADLGDKRSSDIQNLSKLKDVKGSQKVATDIISTVGNIAPTMALPVAKLAVMAASAGGNSARQAENEGATPQQALAYGAISGGIEAGTEKMFGFMPFLNKTGLLDKTVKRLINPINNKVIKAIANRGIGALGEGVEEVVSGALDPLNQKITYNENAKPTSAKDLAYQGMLGSVLSGLLGLPSVVNDIYSTYDTNTPQKAQEVAKTLPSTYESNTAKPVQDMTETEKAEFVEKVKIDVSDYATNRLNQLAEQDEQEELQRTALQGNIASVPVEEADPLVSNAIKPMATVNTVKSLQSTKARSNQQVNPTEAVSTKTEPWQMTKQELLDGKLQQFDIDTGLNKYTLERKFISGQKPKYNRKTKGYEMVDNSRVAFVQKGNNSEKNIDYIHKQAVKKALSEGKPVPREVLYDYPDLIPQATATVNTPIVAKDIPIVETVATGAIQNTETDPSKVQEIKNSIAEGEMILKSGKTISGRTMAKAELDSVERSVNKAKAKIGIETTPTLNGTSLADRNIGTVGKDSVISKKTVNAYQFDNPEVKPYYQEYAKYILEFEFIQNMNLDRETRVMKMLKSDTGLTPKVIKDGLERLVADNGQENIAAAKRIELVIDDMLTNGFDAVDGSSVPPIKGYIAIKNKLEGTNLTGEPKIEVDLPISKNEVAEPKKNLTPSNQKKYDALKVMLDDLIAKKSNAITDEEVSTIEKDIEKIRINLQLFAQSPSLANTGEQDVSDFYANSILNSLIIPENVKELLNEVNFMYNKESNAGQLQQAALNIKDDMDGTMRKLEKQESLQGGTDTAEALLITKILVEKSKNTGDYGELEDWLESIRPKITATAQSLQAMSMFKRLTPENTLIQAKKIVDESRTPADKKVLDDTQKQIQDEFDNVEDTTGTVAKDALKKTNELSKKAKARKDAKNGNGSTGNVEQKDVDEIDPAELLMVRIESTLADPKAKDHDFITDMVNELFNVAKESPLPERAATNKKDPLFFISQAIQNRDQYRDIWIKAKEKLQTKYEGTDEFDMLSDYFEKGIKPTFSVKTLDSSIARYISSLKAQESNETTKSTAVKLDDLVKNYYAVGEKTVAKMIDDMIKRAGLEGQDAVTLEKYVRTRLHELTKTKRESILAGIFKESVPVEVDRLRTVKELSNLGAFKHETYSKKAFEKLSNEAKKIVAKSGIDFGKVALSSVENEQLNKAKLLKEVSEKLNINDSDLKLVVEAIGNEFDKVLEKKKNSIANVFSKKEIKKKAFYDKLISYYEKGYFNNPRLREIIAEKMGMPSLTDGAMEKLISETEQLAKIPKTGFKNWVEREEIETRILTDLKNVVPVTFWKKVATVQAIQQLLNAKTAGRNILGNVGAYYSERGARNIMSLIDWGKSFTGLERQITFKNGNDIFKDTEGRWRFARDVLKASNAAWKGYNLYGFDAEKDVKHLTTSSNTFKSNLNPFKWAEKTLNVTLRGFDYAAYMKGVRSMAGETAYVAGLNQGLNGKELKNFAMNYLNNMDKVAFETSKEFGRRVTFQDSKNPIGDTFGELKTLMNKIGLGKTTKGGMKTHDIGLGDVMLKYGRTLGVMLHRSLEFSPAGFVMSANDVVNVISAKKRGELADSKVITEGIARAIFGTVAFTGFGMLLESLGIISGGEDDWEMEDLQRKIGLGKYRVNVSALFRYVLSGFNKQETNPQDGDYVYSYDWIQPIAMSVAFGANMSKDIREKNRVSASGVVKTVGAGVGGIMDTIGEQGGFTGISRLMQTRNLADAAKYAGGNMVTGFTGTFSNQLRQLTDNITRDTSDSDFTKQLMNMVANRLPGLSKKLPEKVDEQGQVKEIYMDSSNNAFNVFLNPAFVSRYKPTDGMKLLIDIYASTGETKIAPRAVSKSVTKDGIKINLTKEEISQFQKDAGQAIMSKLDDLNTDSKFNSLKTDFAKAEYIYSKVLNSTMTDVRNNLIDSIRDDDPRYADQVKSNKQKYGK